MNFFKRLFGKSGKEEVVEAPEEDPRDISAVRWDIGGWKKDESVQVYFAVENYLTDLQTKINDLVPDEGQRKAMGLEDYIERKRFISRDPVQLRLNGSLENTQKTYERIISNIEGFIDAKNPAFLAEFDKTTGRFDDNRYWENDNVKCHNGLKSLAQELGGKYHVGEIFCGTRAFSLEDAGIFDLARTYAGADDETNSAVAKAIFDVMGDGSYELNAVTSTSGIFVELHGGGIPNEVYGAIAEQVIVHRPKITDYLTQLEIDTKDGKIHRFTEILDINKDRLRSEGADYVAKAADLAFGD